MPQKKLEDGSSPVFPSMQNSPRSRFEERLNGLSVLSVNVPRVELPSDFSVDDPAGDPYGLHPHHELLRDNLIHSPRVIDVDEEVIDVEEEEERRKRQRNAFHKNGEIPSSIKNLPVRVIKMSGAELENLRCFSQMPTSQIYDRVAREMMEQNEDVQGCQVVLLHRNQLVKCSHRSLEDELLGTLTLGGEKHDIMAEEIQLQVCAKLPSTPLEKEHFNALSLSKIPLVNHWSFIVGVEVSHRPLVFRGPCDGLLKMRRDRPSLNTDNAAGDLYDYLIDYAAPIAGMWPWPSFKLSLGGARIKKSHHMSVKEFIQLHRAYGSLRSYTKSTGHKEVVINVELDRTPYVKWLTKMFKLKKFMQNNFKNGYDVMTKWYSLFQLVVPRRKHSYGYFDTDTDCLMGDNFETAGNYNYCTACSSSSSSSAAARHTCREMRGEMRADLCNELASDGIRIDREKRYKKPGPKCSGNFCPLSSSKTRSVSTPQLNEEFKDDIEDIEDAFNGEFDERVRVLLRVEDAETLHPTTRIPRCWPEALLDPLPLNEGHLINVNCLSITAQKVDRFGRGFGRIYEYSEFTQDAHRPFPGRWLRDAIANLLELEHGSGLLPELLKERSAWSFKSHAAGKWYDFISQEDTLLGHGTKSTRDILAMWNQVQRKRNQINMNKTKDNDPVMVLKYEITKAAKAKASWRCVRTHCCETYLDEAKLGMIDGMHKIFAGVFGMWIAYHMVLFIYDTIPDGSYSSMMDFFHSPPVLLLSPFLFGFASYLD